MREKGKGKKIVAMELEVKGKVYKVKFGYNSFCDTDLMDRTTDLIKLFDEKKTEDDKDALAMGKLKDLFCCVRDLLFVGFEKSNPVENKQEIGNILDDWKEEAKEGEKRGLFNLFTSLSEELMNEGFFADLTEEKEEKTKTTQDHKKSEK